MIEEWQSEPEQTTIAGLQGLCEALVKAREARKAIEDEADKLKESEKELEFKILNIMKENALPNFKGEFGTISIKNNKSITQPEDMEHKLQLFEYLKSEGIFEEMVNVNSRTLNSWATKEIEAREKDGQFGWVPPGLKAPTEFQSLSVRKK